MKDPNRHAHLSPATGTARWNAWKEFQRGTAELTSWQDARDFVARGPHAGVPGSGFYVNLSYFIRYASIPLGADDAQTAIYHALVERLGNPPLDGGT